MQVECKFIFNSIEEMLEFASRVANAGASVPESAPVVQEPAKAPKASKASKAAATVQALAPADTTANPFAGADMGQPVNSDPAQNTQAVPAGFDREAIKAEASNFIQTAVAKGIEIGKVAEIMNNKYFIPRGMAQCKVGDLNDHQLADFQKELHTSIAPAVRELIAQKAQPANSSLI